MLWRCWLQTGDDRCDLVSPDDEVGVEVELEGGDDLKLLKNKQTNKQTVLHESAEMRLFKLSHILVQRAVSLTLELLLPATLERVFVFMLRLTSRLLSLWWSHLKVDASAAFTSYLSFKMNLMPLKLYISYLLTSLLSYFNHIALKPMLHFLLAPTLQVINVIFSWACRRMSKLSVVISSFCLS